MAAEEKKIYSKKVARHYDLPISHFFGKYKKLAFDETSLKKGDSVLVFCCGTGLDFPAILQKIGKAGKIVGVDISPAMLGRARKKIGRNKWQNIKLIAADVTRFTYEADEKFDAGVCTLGMSIIPRYQEAYRNLLAHVKKTGEIVIGDMQLAPGRYARLNPLTVWLAKKYGGSYAGHRNSTELCSLLEKELSDFRKKEFFFKSYFYCIGKKQA